MARVVPAVACAGCSFLFAAQGFASPTAQLSYARAEGAEGCPEKREVRRALAERLGYDPVDENSPQIIAAIVEKTQTGFRARVELIAAGLSQGLRELTSEGSCAELVSAMALSMSIAIDPERAEQGSSPVSAPAGAEAAFASESPPAPVAAVPEPSQVPPVAVAPVAAPPPAPPIVRNAPKAIEQSAAPRGAGLKLPIDYSLGAFVEVASGFTPGTTAGGALRVRGRHGSFSVSLEGRLDAPSGLDLSGGVQVHAGLAALVLAPCLHYGPAFGCALATGGEVWAGSSGGDDPRSDVALYSALGARLGVDWPENGAWALSLHADGLRPLTDISIRAGGASVWEAPSLALTAGAGGVVRF